MSKAEEKLQEEAEQDLAKVKSDKEIIEMFSDIVPNTNMIAIVPPLVQRYYNVNHKNPEREPKYLQKTDDVFDKETLEAFMKHGCLVVAIGHNVDTNYPAVEVGKTVYIRENGQRGIRVEDEGYACIVMEPFNVAYIQDNRD